MHDVLDPSGGRVAIPNDGNVAMQLLVAAWQQKKPGTSAIMLEGSSNLPNTGYTSLPSQMHSHFVMHVFFLELASLQLICKAQRGRSNKHRCCARARSTLWEHQGVASLARARVERESVRAPGMHLQYIARNYKYKYDSKYGALWTCP